MYKKIQLFLIIIKLGAYSQQVDLRTKVLCPKLNDVRSSTTEEMTIEECSDPYLFCYAESKYHDVLRETVLTTGCFNDTILADYGITDDQFRKKCNIHREPRDVDRCTHMYSDEVYLGSICCAENYRTAIQTFSWYNVMNLKEGDEFYEELTQSNEFLKHNKWGDASRNDLKVSHYSFYINNYSKLLRSREESVERGYDGSEEKTSYSYVNCRKALVKFGETDMENAEKWLREAAAKEGWAKAAKLGSRVTSNGLVAVACDVSTAAVVELSCETDFVARSDHFKQLLQNISSSALTKAKSDLGTKEQKEIQSISYGNSLPEFWFKNRMVT